MADIDIVRDSLKSMTGTRLSAEQLKIVTDAYTAHVQATATSATTIQDFGDFATAEIAAAGTDSAKKEPWKKALEAYNANQELVPGLVAIGGGKMGADGRIALKDPAAGTGDPGASGQKWGGTFWETLSGIGGGIKNFFTENPIAAGAAALVGIIGAAMGGLDPLILLLLAAVAFVAGGFLGDAKGGNGLFSGLTGPRAKADAIRDQAPVVALPAPTGLGFELVQKNGNEWVLTDDAKDGNKAKVFSHKIPGSDDVVYYKVADDRRAVEIVGLAKMTEDGDGKKVANQMVPSDLKKPIIIGLGADNRVPREFDTLLQGNKDFSDLKLRADQESTHHQMLTSTKAPDPDGHMESKLGEVTVGTTKYNVVMIGKYDPKIKATESDKKPKNLTFNRLELRDGSNAGIPVPIDSNNIEKGLWTLSASEMTPGGTLVFSEKTEKFNPYMEYLRKGAAEKAVAAATKAGTIDKLASFSPEVKDAANQVKRDLEEGKLGGATTPFVPFNADLAKPDKRELG